MAKRLILLIATLVLVVCALELGTRLFSKIGPRLTMADPAVGRKYRPGFDGRIYVPEAGRKIRLRFNRDGFRGPDRSHDKPSGVARVALLGDSFVLGAATEEVDSIAGQLETALNRSRPNAWEVQNYGVSGSSPGQSLAVYRNVASLYQPDVVICTFAVINDLIDTSPRLSRSAALYFDLDLTGTLHQLPVDADSERASDWLSLHSRFYNWQKIALRELRYKARKRAGVLKPGKRIFATAQDAEVEHAWDLIAAIVRTFASEATRDGARFLLAAIPAPEEIYDDYWEEIRATEAGPRALDRTLPNRRLEHIAEAAGVPFVSMTERFRAAAPAARLDLAAEQLFLERIGHWNVEGSRLAAQALFDAITVGEPPGNDSSPVG